MSRFVLAATVALFGASFVVAPASAANTNLLDQCKAEIGWSRLTPAQQASPEIQFRLELCLKRKRMGR